jgi:hypothetical protein
MLVRVTVAKTAGAGHAEGSLGVVWLHVCGAQRAPRESGEYKDGIPSCKRLLSGRANSVAAWPGSAAAKTGTAHATADTTLFLNERMPATRRDGRKATQQTRTESCKWMQRRGKGTTKVPACRRRAAVRNREAGGRDQKSQIRHQRRGPARIKGACAVGSHRSAWRSALIIRPDRGPLEQARGGITIQSISD